MFKSLFEYTIHKPPINKGKSRQEIWHQNGLGIKLHNNLNKEHIRSSKVSGMFRRNEDIEITYFYIQKEMKQKYVIDKRHRIFLTSNGQTHYRLPATIIDEAKLSVLREKLIIEVNCNHLSLDTRLEIFTSNRQDMDKEIEREMIDQIKYFIANDKFLLEEQERLEDESLKTAFTKDSKEIRQEFAEMLKDYNEFAEFKIKSNREKRKGEKKGDGEKGRNYKEIRLLEEPTFIKITNNKDPIEAVVNENCEINLLIDITDKSYRSNHYSIQIDDKLNEKVKYQVSDTKNGRSKANIKFINAKLDERIYITFFLKSKNRKTLITKSREILIVEDKKDNNGNKEKNANSPDLVQVNREDKNYRSDILKWHEEEGVAKFYESKNKKIIYVNMSYTGLEKFLSSLKSTININKLNKIKKEYFYNIAFSTFLIHTNEEFKSLNLNRLNSYDELPNEEKIIDRCLIISSNTIMRYLKKKYSK